MDSAFLLWAARAYGCDVHAYYVSTAFQPAFEREDARRLAQELGVPMTVIETDVLAVPEAAANGPDRRYHCKRALFSRSAASPRRRPHPAPGRHQRLGRRRGPAQMPALRELEVRSPLRECGLTKEEVRARSRRPGSSPGTSPPMPVWPPAFPPAPPSPPPIWSGWSRAEDSLFALGFSDFRVRLAGDAARIQIPADQMEGLLKRREEILKQLAPHFSAVLLDLDARTPSR